MLKYKYPLTILIFLVITGIIVIKVSYSQIYLTNVAKLTEHLVLSKMLRQQGVSSNLYQTQKSLLCASLSAVHFSTESGWVSVNKNHAIAINLAEQKCEGFQAEDILNILCREGQELKIECKQRIE